MSCPKLKNEITYTPLYKVEVWAFGSGGVGDKGTGNGGVEKFWYDFLNSANFTNIATIKTDISNKLEELVTAYNAYVVEMQASQIDFEKVLPAIRGYANMKYITMLAPPPDPGVPDPTDFGENPNLEYLTKDDRFPEAAQFPRRPTSHGFENPDDPPLVMRVSSANTFSSMLPLPVSSQGPYGYVDNRTALTTDNVIVASEYVFKDGDIVKMMFQTNPIDIRPSENIWTGSYKIPSNAPLYIVNSVPIGPSGSPEFQLSASPAFDPSDLATAIIDNLTYTAVTPGKIGNAITIEYTDTGAVISPAPPVVNVTDLAITVDIDDGVTTTAEIATAIGASVPATDLVTVTAGDATTASIQGPTSLSGALGVSNPLALAYNGNRGLLVHSIRKDNSLELIPKDDIRRLFGAWRIGLPDPAGIFSIIQGVNVSSTIKLSAPILRAVDTNAAVDYQIPPDGSVITITHTNLNGVKKARNFEATTAFATGTVTTLGTVAGTTIYYNTTGLTTQQQIIQELKAAINSASGFSLTATPKEFIAIDSTVTTDIFLQTIPEYLEDGRIEFDLSANVVVGYLNAGFSTDISYRSDATLITTAHKELLQTITGTAELTSVSNVTIEVPSLSDFDKDQYMNWFTSKLGDQLISKANAIQFGTLSGKKRVYQEKVNEILFLMEDMHLQEVLQRFKWKIEGLN